MHLAARRRAFKMRPVDSPRSEMRPSLALFLSLLFAGTFMPIASAQVPEPPTERETLEPGTYLYFEFDDPTISDVDVLVRASGRVDVLAFEAQWFNEYKAAQNGARGRSWYYIADGRFIDTDHVRHTFHFPEPGRYYIVIDNTDSPDGGAPGNTRVTADIGTVVLTPTGLQTGPGHFFNTLLLRQDYWEVPFLTGIGVAGPTLIFLFVALVAESIARAKDPQRFGALALMAGLGAVFTFFVPSEGVYLPDTRLLTIPAAYLGYRAFKRTSDTVASAAGVFSACFWGPLIGADILNLLIHYDTVREGYLYGGSVMIIGGAGWADALILVPAFGLVSFAGFRVGARHTRVALQTSLQGDTRSGTLFVKVINEGEHATRGLSYEVAWGGEGLPTEVRDSGTLDPLEPGYERTLSVPDLHAGVRSDIREWGWLRVTVWAENAAPVVDFITLAWDAEPSRVVPVQDVLPAAPSYARLPPCASSPDGQHRFELKRLVTEGRSEEWQVCRLCRYPTRL